MLGWSILIVESDRILRQTLVSLLLERGEFRTREAASLAEALCHLGKEDIQTDLVLLDADLPNGDGLSLCKQMRQQGHHMPIIMLGSMDSEADVVRGLDNGANDYVCKPFRAAELSARVRAQLRVYNSSENATFNVGPYIFRPANRTLVRQKDGRKIRLTGKETLLLKY